MVYMAGDSLLVSGESRNTKIASFHSNAVLLHYHTSTSRWLNLFGLFYSQLMLMLLYESSKLWTIIATYVIRKEVESFALQAAVGWCTVLLKDRIVIYNVFNSFQ